MPDTITPDRSYAVSTGALPASRKIHVAGSIHPQIRVPLREIDLSPSAGEPPVRVYDSSGPYTDPAAAIDIRAGLAAIRQPWIEARGDVEAYAGRGWRPEDDGLRRNQSPDQPVFPAPGRKPLKALAGQAVTQLAYARRGIVTPEMEYIAIRENLGRRMALEQAREILKDGESFGAALPEHVTGEFVRQEVARGRAIIPANINHPESEPMIIGSDSG